MVIFAGFGAAIVVDIIAIGAADGAAVVFLTTFLVATLRFWTLVAGFFAATWVFFWAF